MDTKKLLLIFIPALLFVLLGFAFRVYQYEPLIPNKKNTQEEKKLDLVPLLAEDPIIGEKKAPITIVAFEDLACGGCRAQSEIFDALIAQYPGKIKIIWKLLNVTTFPHNTELAHDYAFCAHEQGKFVEFKKAAFANSTNLSENILKTIVSSSGLNEKKFLACLATDRPKQYREKNHAIASLLHIQAVPALFMDNKQIQTPATIEHWKTLLNLE